MKSETVIHESEITLYFQNIFQSGKTKYHPKIKDSHSNLQLHQIYIPILDEPPKKEELSFAVKKWVEVLGLMVFRQKFLK